MADLVTTFSGTLIQALNDSAKVIFQNFVMLIPDLVAAVILFLIGWAIAIFLSRVFEELLRFVKLEKFLAQHKVGDALGKLRISTALIKIAKYYLLLIFVQASVSLIQLGTISNFLTAVLLWAPVFVGAILLMVVAAIFGELVKQKTIAIEGKSKVIIWAANIGKALVLFFGAVMALSTLGFDTRIVVETFITLVQGLVWGISLAFAIAFGLGGQEDAKGIIKDSRKHFKV